MTITSKPDWGDILTKDGLATYRFQTFLDEIDNFISLIGVQTVTNLGSGEGVAAGIVITDLQLKSLVEGAFIDITSTSTEITFALSGLTTTDVPEGTNLYYTEARVSANTDVAANTADRHTHSNKAILDATTASYTIAEETKLAGIEALATVDQNIWETISSDSGSTTANTTTDTLTIVGGTDIDTVIVGDTLTINSTASANVDSVNGQTGVVVLDADDIDDAITAHKFVTSSDLTNLSNLSGTNTGDQTSIVGITGTTAQFNTSLSDGSFATLAGIETLTNKTLTAPTINGAVGGTSTSMTITALTSTTINGVSAATAQYTTAEETKLAGIETGAQVNDVDSVNSQTGVVVLDADDISDAATTNKFTTAAEITKLAGIETLADVTDAANVVAALLNQNLDLGTGTLDASATTVTSLTANGNYVNPGQPTFNVNHSSTASNVTGNGATHTVVFDSERFDQGSDFNATTGVFTAPVDGRYLLTTTLRIGGITAAADTYTLNIVTSNLTYQQFVSDTNDLPSTMNVRAQLIADMDAGDTASITIRGTGEASNVWDVFGAVSQQSFFTGCLLA